MTDLQEAIHQFRDVYDRLFLLIGRYPAHKINQKGAHEDWSPREVLAHLCGQLAWYIDQFAYRPDDMDKTLLERPPSGFNKDAVLSRTGMTWDEIVKELRESVATLGNHYAFLLDSNQHHTYFADQLRALILECQERGNELEAFAHFSLYEEE